MNFLLYYPSKSIGGAQTLVARVASALQYKNHNVSIVDFEDGVYAQLVDTSRINIINIDNIKDKVYVQENVNVITPACFIDNIYEKIDLKEGDKLLFWVIHPYNLIVNLFLYKTFESLNPHLMRFFIKLTHKKDLIRIRQVVENCIENNRLVFMDGEGMKISRTYLGFQSNPQFLPIPIKKTSKVKTTKNTHVHSCWLGRVEDFKTSMLICVLNDFVKCCNSSDLFYVIGDGKDLEIIKQKYYDQEQIKFLGGISLKKLDNFLIENVNLMFAMGTSALESAKLRIPTILLDVSYEKEIRGYKYSWLYQTDKFCLGRVLTNELKKNSNGITFQEVMSEMHSNYEQQCKKVYDYFLFNHEISRTIQEIEQLFESSLELSNTSASVLLSREPRSFFSVLAMFLKKIKNELKSW